MARIPETEADLIRRFGPTPAFTPPLGWDAAHRPDRLVDTHCCFCGQQCGIRLKVKSNRVVGFEPREDFPFNAGKLCPKGVNRYLQGSHPDRLETALERTASGFRPLPYAQAIERTAAEFRRIQSAHGPDAVAVISGASLTNEKAYLMGKFARVGLRTANIDYNGRLCMVSAGAANMKAFGIDRAANPWSDIPDAEVILVAGSNVAECSPITVDYLWRARDRGARLIFVDPRITPAARTADVYLPVKPGRDALLLGGMLHLLIKAGRIDQRFIAEHTVGFDAVAESVADLTPTETARACGVAESALRRAAELWGEARTSFLLHARGIEHHTHGVENCLSAINLVLATGRIGRPGCGYATITGQGNGQGGREHGQRCNQLPGARLIDNPQHRAHVAGVWGVDPAELPGPGVDCLKIFELAHERKVRGLLLICFNPKVSLPDGRFIAEALDRLEFLAVIDFFLSETAAHADVVLPGSLHEEDEGTVTTAEGRVVKVNKAVDPPGEARQDWKIVCDLAAALGRARYFDFRSPREIFDELRRASRGGVADYFGVTYEKIERQQGVFWPCPDLEHPGTPRLFEGGRFGHPDGKARFCVARWRPPAEDPDADYPFFLTTGRVVSQYLSGTQTRRIGPLVAEYPEPRVEIHPRPAAALGIADGDTVRLESRRGEIVLAASVVRTIRPDTVFVPYHWGGAKSINRLTIRAQDPVSKIPEYKVCAVRIAKVAGPPPT
jgi:assimilatory nitrate reductase catalytic subunit